METEDFSQNIQKHMRAEDFSPDVHRYIENLVTRYPRLAEIKVQMTEAYHVMEDAYTSGYKLLIAGNGGSAADSEHIAGELMKSFRMPRPVGDAFAEKLISIDPDRGAHLAAHLERSLMTIPLAAHEALITAYINDADSSSVFAQQVLGFGRPGDVFLAISTSGNSKNIMNAVVVAKALDMKVIGLTGKDGGELKSAADAAVCVPEMETYMIQELHLPIYHCWCMMLEDHFFGRK